MADHIIQTDNTFWNIRGSFKIGGVVDIGTHTSLAKLQSGGFVLLDSYTLKGQVKDEVMALTDDGKMVEAVINTHPFHTVHCERVHADFPDAKHYGTARHVKRFPDLMWQDTLVEDPAFAELFAPDFDFSIPRGVDFISANENVHFSSVLAYHHKSRSLHVDDTLMYVNLPRAAKLVVGKPIAFHPTLPMALEKRAGAAQDFRDWARELGERFAFTGHVCTAHTASLSVSTSLKELVDAALKRVEPILKLHERKYG